MKLRSFLKLLLPVIGVSAIAITLPITLTSCGSKENNENKNNNPNQDNNPKPDAPVEEKLTTSIEKINNLTQNFDSLFKTSNLQVNSETAKVIDANSFENTMLENLGIPKNFVKSLNLKLVEETIDSDVQWEFQVTLKNEHQFDSNLTTNESKDKSFICTSNTLTYIFTPNFDYITINLDNNFVKQGLESFVESINIPSKAHLAEKTNDNTSFNLTFDYQYYLKNQNFNWFACAIADITLSNIQEVGNSKTQFTYDLKIVSNNPFVLVDSNNQVQDQTSLTNLTYNLLAIDFDSFKEKLTQQVQTFANSAESIKQENELNKLVNQLEEQLSQSIFNNQKKVRAVLTINSTNANTYTLNIYLPGNYQIQNLPPEPEPDKETTFVANGYQNGIQYYQIISTQITDSTN